MYSIPRKNTLTKLRIERSELGADDYFGPTLPGQSWSQYESFMKMPIYTTGAAVTGLLIAGPIGAIVGGVGAWLLNADGAGHNNKPKTQGG